MFNSGDMEGCLLCGDCVHTGGLCEKHSEDLREDGDITAEQISSREVEHPLGWLVDQWGRTHPLGGTDTIGRTLGACTVQVVHHSVSSRHARVVIRDGQLSLVDSRSLNGTYLNGQRIERARLYNGDFATFGKVSFYFVVRASAASDLPHGVGGTVPTKVASALSVRLSGEGLVAEVFERGPCGVLRLGGETLDLTHLEFALMRALLQPALEYDDPTMHFVSTQTLLRSLDFRSLSPTGENLRELVRRVRVKLAKVGMKSVIESKRGVGYRVRWAVTDIS